MKFKFINLAYDLEKPSLLNKNVDLYAYWLACVILNSSPGGAYLLKYKQTFLDRILRNITLFTAAPLSSCHLSQPHFIRSSMIVSNDIT